MAVYGDLVDLPIPEILNMLGRRTGRLELRGVPDLEAMDLYLREGLLLGLRVGEVMVDDPFQVRDRLLAAMDSTTGTFAFYPTPAAELPGELHLPTIRLLKEMASAVDESGAYRDYFVSPETRFKAMASPNLWLENNVYAFLEGAKTYLERGTSAVELSTTLSLNLRQVQNHLFRLRSIGKIAPVRDLDGDNGSGVSGDPEGSLLA